MMFAVVKRLLFLAELETLELANCSQITKISDTMKKPERQALQA